MSDDHEPASRRRMRPFVFLIGSGLWIAVFVVLFIAMRQRSVLEAGAQGDAATLQNADDPVVVPQLAKVEWPVRDVPEFSLINQDSATVSKETLAGRPWVAAFVFTRCAGSCPKVMGQLKVLQNRLKELPVMFVAFSVQPENDTPEVLQTYAKGLGVDSRKWHFLTGDKDEIHGLIRNGFYQYVAPARQAVPEPGWEVEHTNNVCLVDQQGRVVGSFDSLKDEEIAKLRKEVNRLLRNEGSDEAAKPVMKDESK